MGKAITIAVVIGVFFGGIIGTIQIQKVSQSEYNNHLIMYKDDRAVQLDRFNDILDKYSTDLERREVKIDAMFSEQQRFNDVIKQKIRNIVSNRHS